MLLDDQSDIPFPPLLWYLDHVKWDDIHSEQEARTWNQLVDSSCPEWLTQEPRQRYTKCETERWHIMTWGIRDSTWCSMWGESEKEILYKLFQSAEELQLQSNLHLNIVRSAHRRHSYIRHPPHISTLYIRISYPHKQHWRPFEKKSTKTVENENYDFVGSNCFNRWGQHM